MQVGVSVRTAEPIFSHVMLFAAYTDEDVQGKQLKQLRRRQSHTGQYSSAARARGTAEAAGARCRVACFIIILCDCEPAGAGGGRAHVESTSCL